jgi:probable rRNA maturation factor
VIYLSNRTRNAGIDAPALAETLEALLAAIGEAGTSVSLTFVRDAPMRALNRTHRGKDAPTDVLSFPLFDPEQFDRSGETRPLQRGVHGSEGLPGDDAGERLLGDIVISVDTAGRQAQAYDAPLQRELERLLIHAVLHLAGHDHEEPGERAVMEREERRLAAVVGMPWPYLESAAG